jgi:molybdenum cofactor cytidylyltransferase
LTLTDGRDSLSHVTIDTKRYLPGDVSTRIYPIVLAAGRSARMGKPKLLMDFDGKQCITLVIEACVTSCLGHPIVVLGHDAESLRPLLPPHGVHLVTHPTYDLGQTSSLKVGLKELPDNAIAFLIFPADMPLITGPDLRGLAAAFAARTELTRQIFIPALRFRGGHPVLVDAALKQEFLDLPDEDPARNLIYKNRSRLSYVDVGHRGIFTDMDTMKDYYECLKEYRRVHGGPAPAPRDTSIHAPKPPPTSTAPAGTA